MTKTFTRILAVSVLAIGAAYATSAIAAEKLSHAYFWGPKHHMQKSTQAWIDTVKEVSGGNLIIEMDTARIGGVRGQYDLVSKGVRDTVWFIPSYTPGRFPMYQVSELPFICPNATVCSPVLWEWYKKHDLEKDEFTDTKLLVSFTHGPGILHTKRSITTIDELQGVKVRAGGSNVEVAKLLGAAVVSLPASEAYEAIQRGTAEGVLFPWEAMISFRLNEMATHHLLVPGGFYTASFGININPKAWDGLSAAGKEALMKAGGLAGSKLLGEKWDAADERSRADAIEKKNVITTLSGDQIPIWQKRLEPIRQNWLKTAKERGYDGEKLLDDFEAMVKAHSS